MRRRSRESAAFALVTILATGSLLFFGPSDIPAATNGNETVTNRGENPKLWDDIENALRQATIEGVVQFINPSGSGADRAAAVEVKTDRELLTLALNDAGGGWAVVRVLDKRSLQDSVMCSPGQVDAETLTGVRCVSPPRATTKKPPKYPPGARTLRATATVHVKFLLDEEGKPGHVTVLDCSRPGLGFEAEAVKAVERWQYAPTTIVGTPVAIFVDTHVTFGPS